MHIRQGYSKKREWGRGREDTGTCWCVWWCNWSYRCMIYPFWCEGGGTNAEEGGPYLACHTFTCSIILVSIHDPVTRTSPCMVKHSLQCAPPRALWSTHVHVPTFFSFLSKFLSNYETTVFQSLTNESFSSPWRSKQQDPLWRTAKTFEYITALT